MLLTSIALVVARAACPRVSRERAVPGATPSPALAGKLPAPQTVAGCQPALQAAARAASTTLPPMPRPEPGRAVLNRQPCNLASGCAARRGTRLAGGGC